MDPIEKIEVFIRTSISEHMSLQYKTAFWWQKRKKVFEEQSEWREKLSELLKTCPLEVHSHMGFPQGWEALPFWKK